MIDRVGFYGKLPGTGDFVQRQLPVAFVEGWDRHFQRAVETGRRELGEQWTAEWQGGSARRFVLAPGVCGENGWCGVIGPSVDRLGRAFPMVLAAPCADDLGSIVGDAKWFDSLERVYFAGQYDTVSVESFAGQVASLPGPVAHMPQIARGWQEIEREGEEWRLELPEGGAVSAMLAEAWRQSGTQYGARCLWWTHDGAHVLATRGLPRSYATLLAPMRSETRTELSMNGRADHAASLLYQAAAVELPSRPDGAHAARKPSADDVTDNVQHTQDRQELVETVVTVTQVAGSDDHALQCLDGGRTLLLSGDDGPDDPRRRAAHCIRETALTSAPDLASLRRSLSALHPWLRSARERPLEPVREEGAALAVRFTPGEVRVLRIGAAAAWHWRRGQLRPLFVERAAGAGGEFDDLLFGDTWLTMPGLGSADEPDCDEACVELEYGDRLLLLATRALARLPRHLCTQALGLGTGDAARAHLAALAGLGGEPAQWPLAVVEVNI